MNASFGKTLFICGLILQLCINDVRGLKCYTCADCAHGAALSVDCGALGDACLKTDIMGLVSKTCGRHELCAVGSLESGLKNAFSTLTGGQASTKQDISCCQTDYCNNGPSFSTSLALLAIGAAFAIYNA